MSFSEYPQDTIHFDVTAEDVLVSDTVRISVPVNFVVQDGETQERVLTTIKSNLKRFIDAEWNVGPIQRNEIQAGIERVSLTATARVPERENYSLRERARKLGSDTKGLEIGDPQPDYTTPTDKMQAGKRALRSKLLRQVLEEVEEINTTTDRVYRIADVNFASQAFDTSNRAPQAQRFTAAVSTMSAGYETGGGEGEELSHSTKLVMTAAIVLAIDFQNE